MTARILTWIAMLVIARSATITAPAEIFTCDFESETWWEEWGARKRDARTDTVLADDGRKFKPHRGKALRIRIDEGGHYGTSLAFQFKKRTGTEPEEIYFRYHLRFADDWKPERGGKLPGIGGTYGRAGWGGRKVDGTDGWSARGLFRGLKERRTPVGFYCYHADMKGRYGDEWVWDREGFAGLENNRWYRIDQQARLNSPGKNDGILRGWVDGKLVFEKTDVRMRDIETLKIETIWLNLYYGGSWTAATDYHVYMDDVTISHQPIGISEEAAVKAIADLGGHVFRSVSRGRVIEVKLNGVERLTDASLAHVIAFTELTDLSLEETSISGAGLEHVARLERLEWLNLWKTRVDNAGVAHLARLLSLQSLPIGGTRITDDGLIHLKDLPQLAYLGLRDTVITDTGISHLSALPALKELNLRGTKVTDASIPTLSAMKSLEKVWLGETAVTQGGIDSLKAALPGCVIDPRPQTNQFPRLIPRDR